LKVTYGDHLVTLRENVFPSEWSAAWVRSGLYGHAAAAPATTFVVRVTNRVVSCRHTASPSRVLRSDLRSLSQPAGKLKGRFGTPWASRRHTAERTCERLGCCSRRRGPYIRLREVSRITVASVSVAVTKTEAEVRPVVYLEKHAQIARRSVRQQASRSMKCPRRVRRGNLGPAEMTDRQPPRWASGLQTAPVYFSRCARHERRAPPHGAIAQGTRAFFFHISSAKVRAKGTGFHRVRKNIDDLTRSPYRDRAA